jgi:tetratricopeptide (TPR) repeat protein
VGLVALLWSPNGRVWAQKKRKADPEVQASGSKVREAEFYFTEGEKFFILEDYAKALMYYQRTLELTPDNATVHYKIAEVLMTSNRQDDMLRASLSIENALRLEKKNKYFYLLAANIYSSLTRFEKAAETYENMIREVPGTEEYLYELAAVYQYANRIPEAIDTYNRAEKILGLNEISSLQKQRLYLEQGKIKEGIAEGEKLIKAFPDDERYVMGVSEVLEQKGFRSDAIQYLEKFIVNNPESGNAKMLLAGYYRGNNQEQKAQPLLLELFDDPQVELTSKILVMGALNTELNQGKVSGSPNTEKEKFATTLYQKLVKMYSDEPNVRILGGDLFLSTGRNRDAQQEYLKAIGTGEVNYEVYENLLYLETQLELYDQVIAHSDQALEMFPNQYLLYYYNGLANIKKRQYQQAIEVLEQAKKLAGSNAGVLSEISAQLGEAYNGLRQYDKSDKAFEDALLSNPDNNSVLNNYSYFLALRKENLEKAEKMSANLIKNNPENPTFLDTHAWVLFTRGKFKDARKIIERAISTGKASATHFEHYGDILFKLGDVDGAVAQWERARGMNANNEVLNRKISNRKIYE